MSFLGVMFLIGVAALLAGRTISHAQDEDCGMHLTHSFSGIAYLTLLVWGTLPLIVLWSTSRALLFQFFPNGCQKRKHDYYPEALLPFVAAVIALAQVGGWAFFQWIR
jgi:uncharacterized BrkB/YihY/UPF0761 family membrane protein